MDLKSYALIRYSESKQRIEVRIVKVQEEHKEGKFTKEQEILADYYGKNTEDIYYKILIII